MKHFVFITDVHYGAGVNVRTGNPYDDCLRKLKWVAEYCNKNKATLLIGGDVFDKPTIADVYKVPFIKVLRLFNIKPVVIRGNHSTLYNSFDNNDKTTFQVLTESGLWIDLTGKTIDCGDFYVSNEKPLSKIKQDKPVLAMYHGFLNKEDKGWQVMMPDLDSQLSNLILLGHDHVVYDDVYVGTTRVVRPGSFFRCTRQDDSMRQPKIVHIIFDENDKTKPFKLKKVEIPVARDFNEIFKDKEVTIAQTEKENQYDAVIEALASTEQHEYSLVQAVSVVAEPKVVTYIESVLNEEKVKLQSK